MPGRPRHRRGRRSSQFRKGRTRWARPATPTQPPAAVAQTGDFAARPPTPPPVATPPMARLPAMRYPYIYRELWTVGILAVIMLAVLIVLALVLS